ncbi:hypothetical protein K504DRAFT_461854 [Pleomassaria siparia CBS 279.74]|uniref:Uncharacterized protein n=1 Tax=Pleomassaria siparia CBS 279.74 TaxID=1314801 RepID=A0A6G1KKE2_9PLEO|nr:hypothetical protein K504DRAFT_461854 [Pleomassaria siparia CBS 279.74]
MYTVPRNIYLLVVVASSLRRFVPFLPFVARLSENLPSYARTHARTHAARPLACSPARLHVRAVKALRCTEPCHLRSAFSAPAKPPAPQLDPVFLLRFCKKSFDGGACSFESAASLILRLIACTPRHLTASDNLPIPLQRTSHAAPLIVSGYTHSLTHPHPPPALPLAAALRR